ncbi:4-(cytidine 5'-diphospho)-2-C-methyl-D-erythritol kinase [Clostridium formicaceticum]|uniref:4-diphosphocytidyl-2-C-methyl-D-erythritol kinase n=1 Tax=Clostridium formicaceticum TaxID=1497 RepID=A0AAC9WI36_9CLOT|nr:4-(cytidine 5'-diphospho)-2-C-methyl-D-erythritol kinase [Clostridium formicaceticum]AOY75185.1 4-(cytidine 5'-diphospho)-2-C-methyl-D-erythritol kinase [Clostridium formicaceticum]ARE89611.1 4-diphosphocytidyl-2-C-methyl-D-erythritol kinase [Clostridium formicaceticum]
MNKIQLKSRAKINLSLDVLGKRPDGYHEVQMIMQQIDLYDIVTLMDKRDTETIEIITDCEYIPRSNGNIAYKAAELLRDHFHISRGLEIHIDKRIPVAAGLAGGSANAAAVLMGLNKLWELNLSTEELMKFGVKIGADVPFCIQGGAAVAEGIGEKLTTIKGLKNVWMVIAKPSISVSTAEVYSRLDLSKITNKPKLSTLLQALKDEDLYTLCKNMVNVLETITEKRHPMIKELKKKMVEYHALGSMMSGSGPTVFGIFKKYEKAKAAYENLKVINKQTYLVQSYSKGYGDE